MVGEEVCIGVGMAVDNRHGQQDNPAVGLSSDVFSDAAARQCQCFVRLGDS
jgi:hypothetical protein